MKSFTVVAPKKLFALSSAVLAAVVVASCAPAAPAPQGQTGGQQQAQQQGQPRRGGTVRIALSQEPATLNPLLNNQTVVALSARFVFEPLAQYGVDGNLEPVLAAEIPSPQNGGVRTEGNGMVVTWRLKPNLRWADGSPVTSNDIRFTWRVYMNPANAAVNRTGYPDIESIETPDPLTAVIRYRTVYAPFREHFPFLLPAAGFNNNDDVSQSQFNRQPWGTGPFRVRSFTPADNITFERNPNYREEGKPYLDTVVIRILPSVEAALQAFRVGDVDVMWNLPIPSIPEVQTIPGVSLPSQPNFQRVERLMLNLSCPSGPQQGQPTCPHPILGDARVREAIDYAIDRRTLNDRLLSGRGAPVASNVQSQIPPTPFDQARARQLLDQAGWTPGSDGIRTRGGVRMSLELNTTSGNALRERIQQVLQEQFRAVGIELTLQNFPSPVLFSFWQDNAPRSRSRGAYDMQLFTFQFQADPVPGLWSLNHSSQIPSEQLLGGQNFQRLVDPQLDQLMDRSLASIDDRERQQLLTQIQQRIYENRASLFIFAQPDLDPFQGYVQGRRYNARQNLSWDSQNWWLNR